MSDQVRYGSLIRSVIHDAVYRLISVDHTRVTLMNVDTGKRSFMSVENFVRGLESGRFVPANGLDRAIESCKQRRKA